MAKNKKKGSNFKHQWENPEIKHSQVNASTNVNISESTKLIDQLQTVLSTQATEKERVAWWIIYFLQVKFLHENKYLWLRPSYN